MSFELRNCQTRGALWQGISARPSPVPVALGRVRNAHHVQQTKDRNALQPLWPLARAQGPLQDIPVYADIQDTAVHDGTVKLEKPRVVVLGSGWASMSFIKALPPAVKDRAEVVVVSPRNYFLYTPLLPAVAVGTMEERSITEPVRNLLQDKANYYEAACRAIDPVKKELVACFPGEGDSGFGSPCFKLKYDVLFLGVGSTNNTYSIPGVEAHCMPFKSIEDALRLRRRITGCFERAALPYASAEERQRLLSFVVVGGGPTGVEVAAEMHDMIFTDLKNHYQELMPDVKITIVDMLPDVLSSYDTRVRRFVEKKFRREGIQILLEHRVVSVTEGCLTLTSKEQQEQQMGFGACVWATGIAKHPLVEQLQAAFPAQQTHSRCVLTNDHLAVLGSNGSMFAFGDAATIYHPSAKEQADRLFDAADTDKDGKMSVAELTKVLHAASKALPHLHEHVTLLEAQTNRVFGGIVSRVLHGGNHTSNARHGKAAGNGSAPAAAAPLLLHSLTANSTLSREEFKQVLSEIDNGLKPLPATAQVAKQQGEYLADLLMKGQFKQLSGRLEMAAKQAPFRYFHKGSLAYVGDDNAVMDVPALGPILGSEAGVMWKGYETFAQISLRNQVAVLDNFFRTKVFGRDFSQV